MSDATVFCPQGHPVPAGFGYCGTCGAQVTARSASIPGPPPAMPAAGPVPAAAPATAPAPAPPLPPPATSPWQPPAAPAAVPTARAVTEPVSPATPPLAPLPPTTPGPLPLLVPEPLGTAATDGEESVSWSVTAYPADSPPRVIEVPLRRNGMGRSSLAFGIVALLTSPLLGLGAVLGVMAILFAEAGLRRIRRRQATNRPTALWGLWLGIVATIVSLLLLRYYVGLVAPARA